MILHATADGVHKSLMMIRALESVSLGWLIHVVKVREATSHMKHLPTESKVRYPKNKETLHIPTT